MALCDSLNPFLVWIEFVVRAAGDKIVKWDSAGA